MVQRCTIAITETFFCFAVRDKRLIKNKTETDHQMEYWEKKVIFMIFLRVNKMKDIMYNVYHVKIGDILLTPTVGAKNKVSVPY